LSCLQGIPGYFAASQYTSIRFGESLQPAGMTPSIGSAGDANDNALAETTAQIA
jgi:transposase InsO family protein